MCAKCVGRHVLESRDAVLVHLPHRLDRRNIRQVQHIDELESVDGVWGRCESGLEGGFVREAEGDCGDGRLGVGHGEGGAEALGGVGDSAWDEGVLAEVVVEVGGDGDANGGSGRHLARGGVGEHAHDD